MRYRAIFLDLDGTLLNQNRRISRTSQESIRSAQALGVDVVINSGRTPSEIKNLLKKAELNLSYIALNGAYVYDCDSNTVLYEDLVCPRLQNIAADIAEQTGVYTNWYTTDKIYVNYNYSKMVLGLRKDAKEAFLSFLFYGMERGKVEYRPDDFFRQNQAMFYKGAFLCGSTAKKEALRTQLIQSGMAEVSASAPVLLEYNNKGISKKSGMKQYLKYHQLDFSQCIAVGDHENDLAMIQAAGVGVAMGNAIPSVKKAADFITESNAKNGVAKVIHEFILRF